MATSSIFSNISITTEEQAERFVAALEEAESIAIGGFTWHPKPAGSIEMTEFDNPGM